ncbi:MAG: thioredoxin domain-containing protein [Bacteroidota bacterium]|nr:thioredoxin domain-containing protein [Bacteroidota bacterium]MDX5430340.1 thioredoxin domain-containing protein [Bacteroidota bacterium]MDX5469101.1 thioredoxin domain-containing protein [Bacteroidota bacterium]
MSPEPKYTNSLINAQSPYLLQHAHNPVDWLEWSDAAWEKAKNEDKLVLVSIGYASCHWCHVMEHETFENEDSAAIMNDFFVCIKVDREERPDVDQIYMDAIQLITGHGGWPLNMFCLPDGRPIHGGTYFPTRQWNQLLFQLRELYQNKKEEAIDYAAKLTEGIRKMDLNAQAKSTLPDHGALEAILVQWSKQFDWQHGGNARTPKFPLPTNFQFLLRAGQLFPESEALKMVQLTLDKMAYGGIYDQLAGGFARYATDTYWKIPHFEKMLYDNAQLIGLYSRAAAVFNHDFYAEIAKSCIAFIEREWKDASGLYYSSYDADSEGKEGTYYVWTWKELQSILHENDFELFTDYFTCTDEGNWEEGKNILHATLSISDFAKLKQQDPEKVKEIIDRGKQALLEVRRKRIAPGLDDKCILSCNALLLEGLSEAARFLKDDAFRQLAISLGDSIKEYFFKDGTWHRIVKNKQATIPAFLEDHASLCSAYIALYQCSFEEKYLILAKEIADQTHELFSDPESALYFFTSSKSEALIARKKDTTDDVIPSGNAVMSFNYQRLYYYFARPEYRERSQQMLETAAENFSKFAPWYSYWGISMLNASEGLYQLCAGGPGAKPALQSASVAELPNLILAAADTESALPLLQNRIGSAVQFYLCFNESCFAPKARLEDIKSYF